MFGFQQLDVYQAAIKFLGWSKRLGEGLPRGHGVVVEQLARAALSIPLNIAEGSGKSDVDGRRFLRIARGSALECAAILDVVEELQLTTPDGLSEGRSLLVRIVSMLTKMIFPRSAVGPGRGT